jgi:SAM-dependent methyltransferase
MARAQAAKELDGGPESRLGGEVPEDLYGGPEGRLWELVAGEMLHCGGIGQTMAMASKAGIAKGDKVLDLCSGFGSSLRFLAKKFGIEGYGLDISPYMVEQATSAREPRDSKVKSRTSKAAFIKFPGRTRVSMSSGVRTRGAIWIQKRASSKKLPECLNQVALSPFLTG